MKRVLLSGFRLNFRSPLAKPHLLPHTKSAKVAGYESLVPRKENDTAAGTEVPLAAWAQAR